jgi:hypothetical protein
MAQATIELGRLLDKTDFKLFDFPYVFDDAAFKAQIEQQVIDFYYDYEIGQETPDMFKRKFKARWLRMISYYNKLYNTTLLSYNPLTNYSMTEALEQLSTNTSTSTNTSDSIADSTTDTTGNSHTVSDSDAKTSDYPQQPIAGGDYLSGANNIVSDTTTDDTGKVINNATGKVTADSTGSATSNTEYNKTIEGITGGSYPELIEKHRAALMRINDMIIEELKPCFILVF